MGHAKRIFATLLPERNNVFSHVQLKYLHTRVAKILVSIFSKNCSSPGESYSLPRSKLHNVHTSYIIWRETGQELYVASGFQYDKKPDVNSRCDYIYI